MPDTKLNDLSGFTPILTDITYSVDDPGGTPVDGKLTWQQVWTMFQGDVSGDALIASGVLTIANDAVTNAKMANMSALSLKGNPTNSTADPQDITAANDGHVMRRNGTAIGFGQITAAGIADSVVSNEKLATVATARLKGRVTGGTGAVQDLTGTQATTLLDTFTSSLKGLAPASGGGTTNFLRADGTWAAPSGGTVDFSTVSALSGDWRGVGAETLIQATEALQDASSAGLPSIAAQSVLANPTGSSAVPVAVALASSTILGRGSTGNVAALTAGNGLTISGTVIQPSYGSSANTVTQGNDSRLSDSREWTAATVEQAEAETGTATTRRAWTAQRVRQSAQAAIEALPATTSKATAVDADKVPIFDSADSDATKITTVGGMRTAILSAGSVGTTPLADAGVTFAKMQNATRGVLGRAANSSGVMALIAASTPGHVLRLSVTSIGFGTLLAGSFAPNTAPLNTIANQAANTFLANATASSAAVTAVALAASQLAGRGSTGNIAPITMGTNMRMNGTALASDTRTIGTGLGTTGTVNLNLATLTGTFQTIAASGNLTFTTSNYAAGRFLTLRIAAGGSARTLAWPATWVRFGAALPTSLASGTSIVVTIVSRGTTEANTDVTHQVSV